MKKLFFALCVLAVFVGCGEATLYTVRMDNNSSKPVTYSYNNITDALNIGESKTYEGIKAYTQSPKIDENITDVKILYHSLGSDIYEFVDIED